MNDIRYIGLTGVAGAGKDTVFDRLVAVGGDRYVKMSVADSLKESVAALFGITLEQLEELKRDSRAFVDIGRVVEHRTAIDDVDVEFEQLVPPMSIRTFLQRYGTESHRDVFGQDFWLEVWEARAARQLYLKNPCTIVNTSVRFENEAARIIDMGGVVWQVNGPQDAGAGGHSSEVELPDYLITEYIDNETRPTYDSGEPDFSYLDDQLVLLIDGGSLR